jgi:Tfp pilus assembly protein PilW
MKTDAGYSIIELILALGLISVVVSSAGLMLFCGIDRWIQNDARAELQQNLRIGISVLVTEIRRADIVHVYDERLVLEYHSGNLKSYYFDQASAELRLGGSNSTVAMNIAHCSFECSRGIITISISAVHPSVPGLKSYNISIYPRGKAVYAY